jgi:hypothetical protein
MATLVYLPANFQAGFATISGAIWTRLGTNPGSTATQLATALGYTEAQVITVVEIMTQQYIVTRQYDATGIACYWRASQYQDLIIAKIASARTWVINNSGSDIALMATNLSVAYGVAKGLAEALQAELSCKVFFT